MPGAEPFTAAGGPVGALLCHGFTGSPRSMRPWAEHLAAAGLTVSVPLLPGHGTHWRDMALTRWEDWYAGLERGLDDLRARCDAVVVMGLSMGGTLALRLAEQRGDQVAGLVLVNPSLISSDRRLVLLPVLHRLVRSLAGISDDVKKPGVTEGAYDRVPLAALHSLTRLWTVTRRDLGRVTQPVLVFRSAEDHVVEPDSAALLASEVGSADVEERVLRESYHVATLDNDAPRVFADSLDFVRRVVPARTGVPLGGAR